MKNQYFGKPKNSIKNIYRRIFYRWIIKKYLNDCHTVLDIGAGTGIFYDVAKETKSVDGIDLDKRNIRDNIRLQDYREIKKHYDCFFNSQFIEHVNQFEFMEVSQKYCDKILITITPNPNKKFWDDPSHIRPYTIKSIKELYESYGFRPIFSMNLFPTGSFIVIGKKY